MVNTSKRLDSLYQKKVSDHENNFKNIEKLEVLSIQPSIENFKGKKKNVIKKIKSKTKKATKQVVKQTKKVAKQTKKVVKKVAKKIKKKVKKKLGNHKAVIYLHDFFEKLLFFIPNSILYISENIVNIDILRSDQHDPRDELKYADYKISDKKWIYYSGIEFCQIFLSAYIASALYTNIYIEKQSGIESYLKTSFHHINIFLLEYVFIFLLFLPKGFHFLIYDVIFKGEAVASPALPVPPVGVDLGKMGFNDIGNKMTEFISGNNIGKIMNITKKFGGGTESTVTVNYVTTRYLVFYIIAFAICTFFLKNIADMFLDMFLFKAYPSMYIFILLGFLTWAMGVATDMKISVKLSATNSVSIPNPLAIPKMFYMATIAYIIYLFFHVIISLTLAPIAQGTFSLYLFMFLSGGIHFFFKTFGNIFSYSESKISKQLREASVVPPVFSGDSSMWGKILNLLSLFDNFLYTYIFKTNNIMFTFIMMIFFIYKTLVTLIPPFNVHIFGLKIFFSILNILASMTFCYFYYNLVKPVP